MFCNSPSAVFGLAVRPHAPSTYGPGARGSSSSSSRSWVHIPPGYAGRGGACVTFARYGARVGSDAVEVEIGSHTVRISSPDRVYFSARGETKLDLVNYYISVGPGIVRALRERPCMLHRYPDGVDGDKIYQKRLPKGAPEWVETVEVRFPSGRTADE